NHHTLSLPPTREQTLETLTGIEGTTPHPTNEMDSYTQTSRCGPFRRLPSEERNRAHPIYEDGHTALPQRDPTANKPKAAPKTYPKKPITYPPPDTRKTP
ncbi:Hypothetical predicted protein, partial [Pelobates cultripes]